MGGGSYLFGFLAGLLSTFNPCVLPLIPGYISFISGVTLDEIQVPGFWAHMAAYLRPYDHIEARADDGTWVAYLIVTGCDRTWARVVLDRVVKLRAGEAAAA